ncbi:restriction endonuclease subunit S [Streptomyces parvus]|uniref:restriction endonuclease subunit S n=1 Tax=Streptomyces parvus TaxID=66428 RepID=UPI002100FE5E|nr:restriction endonuclease subunit S [Streptomyces parvus]MCQ1580767.1 restriction endonuclease subunit S [Streptomyces parvus]
MNLRSGSSRPQGPDDGPIPVMGAGGPIGHTFKANTDVNSIFIGRVGTVGAVSFPRKKCWASDNVIVATVGPELEADFAYYLLKGARLPELASKTAQPLLTSSAISNLRFAIPAAPEQRQIVEFLNAETSRIDNLASMRRHQFRLLIARNASRLSSLHQKLCHAHGTVRLRHLLTKIEQGWSPQCEDRPAGAGEWGVIKAGCVNSGAFDPSQHKALPADTEPRPEYALEEGDLLMSRASGSQDLIGSVGMVTRPPSNLLLCDKVYRLTVDRTLTKPDFVAYMLRSHPVREHIKLGVSGGDGMANNLPVAVVKDCVLPDVPLSVQAEVVRPLDRDVDVAARARAALEASISLLAERRQALITAAVTGQFDVSTASGRNVTDGV